MSGLNIKVNSMPGFCDENHREDQAEIIKKPWLKSLKNH